MKIVIFCSSCEASCNIKHELEEPYILGFCPFCGEELDEENIDEAAAECAEEEKDEEEKEEEAPVVQMVSMKN